MGGTRVFVKRIKKPSEHQKFTSKWTGPTTILAKPRKNSYEIMSEETGKTRMVHIDQLIECKQINEPQQEETQAPKEEKEKKTQEPKKKKEKKTQTPKKKKEKKTGTQARNDNDYAIRTRSATQAARTHTSTQPAQVMTSSRKDEYAEAIKGVREFFFPLIKTKSHNGTSESSKSDE